MTFDRTRCYDCDAKLDGPQDSLTVHKDDCPMIASNVATTDASWAPEGNRSSMKFHWPKAADPAVAQCGGGILDNMNSHHYSERTGGSAPDDVTARMRCQRPGCKQRWAAWVAANQAGELT